MLGSMTDDHDQLDPAEALMRAVGTQLREVRLERGEELDDIAQALRIKAIYLFGIEQGDLSMMPGRTYALGFLRSYADHLGFDGDDLIAQIKSSVANLTDKTRFRIRTPLPESRLPKTPILVLSLAALAGIYAGWSYLNRSGQLVIETVAEVPGNLRSMALDALSEEGQGSGPVLREAVPPAAERARRRRGPRCAAAASPAPAGESGASPPPDRRPRVGRHRRRRQPPCPEAPPATAAREAAPARRRSRRLRRRPRRAIRPQPSPRRARSPARRRRRRAPSRGSPRQPAGGGARRAAARGRCQRPACRAGAGRPALRPSRRRRRSPSCASGSSACRWSSARRSPPSPRPTPRRSRRGRSRRGGESPGRIHEPENTDARVVLRALDSSWIRISSLGGDYLRTRTLQQGDVFLVPNRSDLELWTGNAGGIEVILDGALLAPLGDDGAVLREVPLDPPSLSARFGEPVLR